MSLTSRVTNLFSSGSTKTQPDRNDLGFVDDGLSGGKEGFTDTKFGTGAAVLMAHHVEEEEARPPYLHVSSHGFFDGAQMLICIVYDCGRNWWNYRRLFDALVGYGKDQTARRSAYSSEIHNNVLINFYDLAAGRHTEGIVRRMGSGFTWIVSRDHHLLWNLRILQEEHD